jgi:opacity protein-like surface antigen
MLKIAFTAGAVLFSLLGISAAQETGHFDASVAWGGVLGVKASPSTGTVSVSPTDSGLLLGTFRFRFNRIHSIEFNYGHTVDSQIYSVPVGQYRVQARISEYSGAYVFSPFRFHRVEPFAFAGLGALRFNPGNTYVNDFQATIGARRQTALAFLYGAGLDYGVWRAFAVRLQYRGLVYKEPTFGIPGFFTGTHGQMPEASIGVVLRF